MHADDELGRLALLVGDVGDDGGHDRADEADAEDDDDFHALCLGFVNQGLDALELAIIVRGLR